MITLEEGTNLVCKAFEEMEGGEIFVKKLPSMKVIFIASAIDSGIEQKTVGVRPSEKLHE